MAEDEKQLSLREQEFAKHYTDVDSPTFLNGTQSVISAKGYNTTTSNSSAQMAREILNRPHVANWIAQELRNMGMGVEVRLRKTRDIADGYTEDTVTVQYDADGKETGRTVVTKPIRADIRLKAMARLDQLDGTNDMQKAQAQVLSDTMRKLSKRMMTEALRTESPQTSEDRHQRVVSQEIDNDTLTASDASQAQEQAHAYAHESDDTGTGARAQGRAQGGSRPPSDDILSPPSPRQSKTKGGLTVSEHGVVYE